MDKDGDRNHRDHRRATWMTEAIGMREVMEMTDTTEITERWQEMTTTEMERSERTEQRDEEK